MKVIVDGFGGDNAPAEVLRGSALAVKEYGVSVIITGDAEKLKVSAQENGISLDGIEFAQAAQVITMEDEPTDVLKAKSDCSMAVGLKLLKTGEGDAFVSAGNTGALVVGSSTLAGRIKGIKRAALAPMLPTTKNPYMLMDSGANLDCRPEMLVQFGIMGSVYMNRIMGIPSPRVGVVNVGTEPTKGTELEIEANRLFSHAPVNCIGNVEARELPLGGCDVAVTDGFTGNVILKLTEGLAKGFSGSLKDMLLKNIGTKLAALALKGGIAEFRKSMDYTEYGGAPLMGIARPVIKAHGSSDAKAFKNAIRQAKLFCEQDVIGEIEAALLELKQNLAAQDEQNKE
ncbi:MAG: phosphate acyltransferase PlsX [Acetanaerobacterium sp.]